MTGDNGGAIPWVSRKLASAVEAVVDIAYHGGLEPVPARDISARLGIQARYLEQVMQRLVHAGVLRGVRGPRGGYVLARERRRVTVGEIARIVRTVEANDLADQAEHRSGLASKVLDPFWDEVQADIMRHLEKTTIDELCQRANRAGVKSSTRGEIDYTI